MASEQSEIRTYQLTIASDGAQRAPLIGPYVGRVPFEARILRAEHDGRVITIDAVIPLGAVPVHRRFLLENHACCGTTLGPAHDVASVVLVEKPRGLANGRLYLFEEGKS